MDLKKVVYQTECSHGLNHDGGALDMVTVVTATDIDGLQVSVLVQAFNRLGNGNYWVESHAELNRHTVAYAALYATAMVGLGDCLIV